MVNNLLNAVRMATQIFGFFLSNAYIAAFVKREIYKGPFKATCIPFLYCHTCPSAAFSCPVGTVQHYLAIHQFPFFDVGHLMLVGLLVGRMVCGWLCPFGLVQDLLYRIQSVKIRIPKLFSVGPYVVLLLLVLWLPYATSEHWFSKLCPVGTLVAGIPWIVWNPINPETGTPTIAAGTVGFLFAVKLILLGGFLYLFVVTKRPFCRFVCPLGLFYSFFNKVSVMKLQVAENCNRCGICQKNCPMDLKVYEDPNALDCIRCLQCTACKKVTITTSLPLTGRKGVEDHASVKEGKLAGRSST